MSKEGNIKCCVYYESNKNVDYEGRFICLVDDEQFNSIVQNPKMAEKLYTMESIPVTLMADSFDATENKRFVMVVAKQDGVKLSSKKLFISERIELVDHFNLKKKELGISCEKSWINIEEN